VFIKVPADKDQLGFVGREFFQFIAPGYKVEQQSVLRQPDKAFGPVNRGRQRRYDPFKFFKVQEFVAGE
jgi:hypothetical protein